MSKLIIVCGLPASGKTTLAQELSRKTGIVCFHKDALKEKIFDLFDGKNLEDSIAIGRKSITLLFKIAEEQLANNVDVIIEAPFSFPEDYSLFESWRKKYKLDLYGVVCLVESGVRKERFYTRERHASHHDRDREVNFNDDYDYKDMPGKQIRIETNRPICVLINEIIEKMK